MIHRPPTFPHADDLRLPDRRAFLRAAARGALAGWIGPRLLGCADGTQGMPAGDDGGMSAPDMAAFPLEEATIADLQAAMESGRATSQSLCESYLGRIGALDAAGPTLHALLEVNPDALSIAADLDKERAMQGPRGPLHGIPILLKGNIASADRMSSTAGSLALVGVKPPEDSTVVQRLRAAGAVILGKTNLSEWANFRSTRSLNGWSAQGGQCRNPYALDRDPCGSSSGSGAGVAASLAAVALGTETDGSILCPSSSHGLVGLKPTLGLISRRGIVPIAHSQDTAGPMARTVRDAAILLGALAGEDPRDPATAGAMSVADYTAMLSNDGLMGAAIGLLDVGSSEAARTVLAAFATTARGLGAAIVENTTIPNNGLWGGAETIVLQYEFKTDIAAYLAEFAPAAQVHSLADLIAFNNANRAAEMPLFGQEIFLAAEQRGPLSDKTYTDALARCQLLARQQGIEAAFNQYRVDAFACVTLPPACLAGDYDPGFIGHAGVTAVSGHPHLTVPGGFVGDLPVGISFIGRRWSEPLLLRYAYAFEQATHHRKPPRFAPSASFSEC